MRYFVLRPTEPFDPRRQKYQSVSEFMMISQSLADCGSETEARDVVHAMLPDVLPLIVKLGIANGVEHSVLGFLDCPSDARLDIKARLPFMLFVVPVADRAGDKQDIKHHRTFDIATWMPRVVDPDDALLTPIEVRSTALPVPTRVVAKVGMHQGRFALRFELGGVATSIVFDSERVLDYVGAVSGARENVTSDGAATE